MKSLSSSIAQLWKQLGGRPRALFHKTGRNKLPTFEAVYYDIQRAGLIKLASKVWAKKGFR